MSLHRPDWPSSWKITAQRTLFWKFDGLLAIWLGVLLAIFVLLQFFNIVLWQLPIVGIVLVFAFYLLNKRGYSIPVFFRLVGFALAGRRARGRKTPKYKM